MMRSSFFRLAMSLLVFAMLIQWLGGPAPVAVAADKDKVSPALRQQMAQNPNKRLPVIVQMVAKPAGTARDRAREASTLLKGLSAGSSLVGELPVVNGAAGSATTAAIDALTRNPNVAAVFYDAPVQARDNTSQNVGQNGAPYPIATRANKVWANGITGKGVGVAVLDSGIAKLADLSLPNSRVVASVNFADALGQMADPGGHGTHVAGTIAGNSLHVDLASKNVQPLSANDPASAADYVGMAPGANLVDVRVLDGQGSGSISSVISGIQWVVANKDRYNIRVMNVSIGAPSNGSYRQDPLSAAIEVAWRRGIVAVVAAGNSGSGNVETPGIDPYAITVGADDDQTTHPVQDDTLASFSSWGTPTNSSAKPDLIAPGRRIVSLRVQGSYLDKSYPDRVVAGETGANYFRLSGTSMATAVVSGAVALMLERHPDMKPDQVKAVLRASTQPFGQTASPPPGGSTGAGLLDANSATFYSGSVTPANQGLRPSDGFCQVVYRLIYGQPLTWKDLTYAGINWTNLGWDNLGWDNLAWDNLGWDNLGWDNLGWDNLGWDNLGWDNVGWSNLGWDQATAALPD